VEDWIRELCRLIAAETDHNRQQELARELDFAITEYNLQLRNRTLSLVKSLGHSSKAPLGNTVEYQ
jgi:hypothetical protein